jgi:hypothetical protein
MAQTATPHLGVTPRSAQGQVLGRDVLGGIFAGEISGLIMAVVMMGVFALILQKTALFPVQVIGSIIYGDRALVGTHLPSIIAGLLLHQLGPALVWGVLFGAAVYAFDARQGGKLAVVAIGAGLIAQIVDVNIILPMVFNALHGHDLWAENVPAFWSWASHLVFGIGLLLFPLVRPASELGVRLKPPPRERVVPKADVKYPGEL